jgi:hypothetical protein
MRIASVALMFTPAVTATVVVDKVPLTVPSLVSYVCPPQFRPAVSVECLCGQL